MRKYEKAEHSIGKTYNMLTVRKIERNPKSSNVIAICDCECGTKDFRTLLNSVRLEKTISCGCYNEKNQFQAKDLTNQRFGKLIARNDTGKKTPKGWHIWKCDCDCGKSPEVPAPLLLNGNTNSCGCLAEENGRKNIVAAQKI